MSGHSEPSYTRPLVGAQSDLGKMPTKDSEMGMARFARRPDAAGETREQATTASRKVSSREDHLTRMVRGLSRRSNLNGPSDTGKEGAGRSEFNRINRIQLKAPSNARLDSAAS